jgi:hypothetical protein
MELLKGLPHGPPFQSGHQRSGQIIIFALLMHGQRSTVELLKVRAHAASYES